MPTHVKDNQENVAYYEARLIIARRRGDTRRMSRILQALSILYFREKLYLESANALIELLPIIESVETPDRLAYYNLMIAKNLILALDCNAAEEYLQKSMAIYDRLGDLLGKVNVYTTYGELHRKLGQNDLCATYLSDALEILNSYNEQLKASNPMSYQVSYDAATEVMSRLMLIMKQFKIGNDLLSKLLEQKKKSGDSIGLTRLLQDIGAANCFTDPDRALVYLKEALEISRQTKDFRVYAPVLSNMGLCHETKGDYEHAIKLYLESYDIMRQHRFTRFYSNVLNNLASASLKDGNIKDAKQYALKSLELSQPEEKQRDNQESFWILSQAYKTENRYDLAYDYLLKHCEINDSLFNANIAAKINSLQKKYEASSTCLDEIKKQYSLITDALIKSMDMNFIGVSDSIQEVYQLAIMAAKHSNTNVIVTGESGVGKEIVARLIHYAGSGNKEPFVDVNCSAIVESLADSEFFGYSKGAFTGATCDKIGFFEAANGGTLFLDEIADTPPLIQAKLLRVLETRTIKRVGSNKSIKVNFRLISATNKNIDVLVRKGLFREDLLYRINTIRIHIPPLRERRDDIGPLVDHFLKEFARKMNKPVPDSSKALAQMQSYHFPGNIRELKNIIERAMITLDGSELRLSDNGSLSVSGESNSEDNSRAASIKQMEYDMIKEALHKCGGSCTRAAIMLGVSYSTVRRKAILIKQET